MLRLKKDTSPDADVTSVPANVTPVLADDDVAPNGIALQKKKLPPAALIGIAVGALALAGLAAYLLTRPAADPESTALVATAPRPGANRVGGSAMGANSATLPGGVRAPGMPDAMAPRPGMPGASNVATAVVPGAGMPGAMTPGVLPPRGAMPSTASPATAAGAAPPVPVVSAAVVRPGPGAPPILAPPSAPVRPLMTPLTPTLKAQLNILWQRGADAKHRGDLNAARGYWKQALRLRPGHPGFAEAIRKLPPQQGNRRR